MRSEEIQDGADLDPEGFHGSFGRFAQQSLEFGEHFLNRVYLTWTLNMIVEIKFIFT